MTLLERITKPTEIYVLLITFIFTEQFDRNLDLTAVEEGSIKNFLGAHILLDSITNHARPIGAAFFIYTITLIIWTMMGKNARKPTDILAIFLTNMDHRTNHYELTPHRTDQKPSPFNHRTSLISTDYINLLLMVVLAHQSSMLHRQSRARHRRLGCTGCT